MAESVFIAGMFVKYGKEFEELCERTGHTELAKKKQGKQWMRCIRQCWIMDGTENGSCVPMMHSLKRLVQKNAKKERLFY